jgi:hypothetical protein
MKYYARNLSCYFERTVIKEQLFQSKVRTKAHAIQLIKSAFAENAQDKFNIESTLVTGLEAPIITGSYVFLYYAAYEGYVWTTIVEYAQMMLWCQRTGKNVAEVEWMLSEHYQGVFAQVYNPETMAFFQDITDQQLQNELLMATSSRYYAKYAWQYGDTPEEVVSWSKDKALYPSVNPIDISIKNYVPLTSLDPDIKNKLSAAAARSTELRQVRNPSGISVGGAVRSQLERQIPLLDPKSLANRPYTGVLNEVYFYARSSYQLAYVSPVRGDLSTLRLYPLQYFLPFSMWETIIEDVPNEMHPDYADLWGLPRKLEMNMLVSEGLNLTTAYLTLTAMPNIQDKQIKSYSLTLVWDKAYSWIKQSKIRGCKVSKTKVNFEVSSFEEIRPLILEYLSQMCTHIKVAVARRETPTRDLPWLSYAADFTAGFKPISQVDSQEPSTAEYDNDLPF